MSEFKKALIDAQEGIAKKVDDEKLNEFIPDQINEKDEKGEELISESEKEEVVEDKEEVKEENTSEQPKRRTRRTRTE